MIGERMAEYADQNETFGDSEDILLLSSRIGWPSSPADSIYLIQ